MAKNANSQLVYKFVLSPGESRQIPVLVDFPEDYSFEVKPVNEAIFAKISEYP